LARTIRAIAAGLEAYKMRLYVGHDGSIIRFIAGLGLGSGDDDGGEGGGEGGGVGGKGSPRLLKWPAFGSEVVIEVSVGSLDR
jgi:hypothetical protein